MIKYASGLALACALLLTACSSSNDEPKDTTPVKTEDATPRPPAEAIAPVVLSFFVVNNAAPSNIDTICAGELFYASEFTDESLIKIVDLGRQGPVTEEGKNNLGFEEKEILASLTADVDENCVD